MKKELTGLEPESSEHWSNALVSSGIGAEKLMHRSLAACAREERKHFSSHAARDKIITTDTFQSQTGSLTGSIMCCKQGTGTDNLHYLCLTDQPESWHSLYEI